LAVLRAVGRAEVKAAAQISVSSNDSSNSLSDVATIFAADRRSLSMHNLLPESMARRIETENTEASDNSG
jgi:ribosome recycling factor